MKRLAIMLCLLLMLAPCARAARTYRTWAEDTIRLYSPREQDWTYVTPENYEAYMELMTAHGFDEEDARTRYASGEIIFEAYHKTALKDGCLRLQVIETPFTRSIWDHTSLSSTGRKELLDDLAAGRHDLPFEFRGPKYTEWNGGGKNNYVDSGFVSMPPYTYESGRLNMQIRNGKAYVLSYAAHHPSTRRDRIRNEDGNAVFERLKDMTLLMDRLPRPAALELDGPVTLQTVRDSMVIRGWSDASAQVSVSCEGAWSNCTTEEDGRFTAEVVFSTSGRYDVVLTAGWDKATETTVVLPVQVSREQCMLMVTKAPKLLEEPGEKTICGQTLPGAEVTIRTGKQTLHLYADKTGGFGGTLDMRRGGAYDIEVEAMYEGMETARTSFVSSTTIDEKVMFSQARERAKNVRIKSFVENPEAHAGKMVSYEARVDEIIYTRGGLKLRVSTVDDENKRHRYMLRTDGYVGDQIYEEMRLTFWGEICGWDDVTTKKGQTLTLPCIQAECLQWVVLH